jgi:hypothetical protein
MEPITANKIYNEEFLNSCTLLEVSLSQYLYAESDKITELISRNADADVLMEVDKYIKFNLNLLKNFELSIVKKIERGI